MNTANIPLSCFQQEETPEYLSEFLGGSKPSFSGIKPRLAYYQGLMSYENPDLDYIQRAFREWSQYREWLLFRGIDHAGNSHWRASLMAKRGNSVYAWRLKKQLKALISGLPDQVFFDRGEGVKTTKALFVTLTYRRQGLRLDQAWEFIGVDYNRWISKLRNKYGRIDAIRVWEAQQDGYPHIHVILIFEKKEFKVFRYNQAWRIEEKSCFEWEHGFVDVEALQSIRGGVRYVVKYLGKLHNVTGLSYTVQGQDTNLQSLLSKVSVLTLSLMWIFHKRSFAVSKSIGDLIRTLINSKAFRVGQVDLWLQPVVKWYLVGFYGGFGWVEWSKELSLYEFLKLKSSPTFTSCERIEEEVRRVYDSDDDSGVLNCNVIDKGRW